MNFAFAWIKPNKTPAQAELEKPDLLRIGLFLCLETLCARPLNHLGHARTLGAYLNIFWDLNHIDPVNLV